MRICLGCGSENNDIVQFCVECGEELTLENIAGDDMELESLRKRRYQLKKKLKIRPERYKYLKKEWNRLKWRKRSPFHSERSSKEKKEVKKEQEELRRDIYEFYKQDDEENNELGSIERIFADVTDLPNYCSHCGRKWKKDSARCCYCGSLIL